MAETITADICIIGAGSGGLSVAAGAAQLGRKVVLIEKHLMGGDCLNTGCVPSKALLAAGKAAHAIRTAGRFGVVAQEPEIDFARTHAHVHGVIAAIEPNDSVARFEGLGVRVILAAARFAGPDTVETDAGHVVRAKRFVIATGSRAATPPIPGIEAVPYLTNETLFNRTALPGHLLIIGGGPIGMEMAQAHRRLGAKVTVVERSTIMPKDDPELVAVVRKALTAEGIDIREGAEILRVEKAGDGIAIVLKSDGGEERVEGTELLVAAGRKVNVDGLGLEAADIAFTPKGVTVDSGLRSTTNRRVYAVGDAAGGPQFTHVAGYHAGVVIKGMLFKLPSKVDYKALPWVTYTDPELAQVGLTEAAARERHGDKVRAVSWPLHENDRAQAERLTEGFAKVVTDAGGQVLGAGIVGAHAGELIQPWALAITAGLKLNAFTSMIAPYPTLGEVNKRAAGAFFTPKLFSAGSRRLVSFLSRFG
ncbi:dihydrolipoyl dehydrogenase family protein [Indioceanicola profundi]|uniref:dihydrolipoyl dehydrogenase family protein n=1 Tax=Indioceanicola profundi TaxID=2220096 RepID=UPI000E6ADB90|nr:FAD-dependent oxidoreductase [Indioceanicola profundi]